MKYRPDIDGLRSVAILPVVFYHAGMPGVSGGFIGVDVFFVISGFLITSIVATEISENRFSLLKFYERRARRIVPALTAVVAATLVVGWFVLLPAELKDLGQSTLATALFLSNVYFALKLDYFAPAAEFAPLLHTWSLAVEEQFYLFFPPLLMALFAWRGLRAAIWVVVALSVASLVAAVVYLSAHPGLVFYLIFFRTWELGIGALLALYRPPTLRHQLSRELIGIASLLAILIPVVLYDTNTPFPGLAALPPVLGTAALIYVGFHSAGSAVTKVLSRPVFVWIGLISYSLYLWHWPVLAFLRVLQEDVSLPLWLGLMAIVVSVLLAWLSYKFVEQPFRTKASAGFSQRAILSFAAAALMAMLVIGGLFHITNGVQSRLAPELVALADADQYQNPDREMCFDQAPADALCALGVPSSDNAPVDFLFWGDSHAEAMRHGVDLAAQNAGKSGLFVGTPACLPIRHIKRTPEVKRCSEINDAVWAFLQDRPDLQTVILTARWPLSVEGERFRQEAGSPVVLTWAGDPQARPSNADNAVLVEDGLRATVEEILATGRQVVLVGAVPEIGWNVPRGLARTMMLGAIFEAPGLSEADYNLRAGRAEQILARLADSQDGVDYLRLSDLFCQDGFCAIADEDGLPLYRDDDHISRQTAQDLLPARLSEIWSEPEM